MSGPKAWVDFIADVLFTAEDLIGFFRISTISRLRSYCRSSEESRIPSRSKALVPVQDRVFDEIGSVAGGMIFVVGSNQLPVWPSSISKGIILGLLCGKLEKVSPSCARVSERAGVNGYHHY